MNIIKYMAAGLAGLFMMTSAVQAQTPVEKFDCSKGDWAPDKTASARFIPPLTLRQDTPYTIENGNRTTGQIWAAEIELELCDKPGVKKTEWLDRFTLSEITRPDAQQFYFDKYGEKTIKAAFAEMSKQLCTGGEANVIVENKAAKGDKNYIGMNAVCPAAF